MSDQIDTTRAIPASETRELRVAMHMICGALADGRVPAALRLGRLLSRVGRSPASIDAAFAAAQSLRDFGTIDHAEAANLFRSFFEAYRRFAGSEKLAATEAAFYRMRGESAVAELLDAKPDLHAKLCADGWHSLISDDRPRANPWASLPESTPTVGLPSAIPESDSARFIDAYLFGTFYRAWEDDAECARLRRAMTALKRAHGLDADEPFPDGQEPFDWKLLATQLERRMNGIVAFWLRRYGEHWLASLLVDRPGAYEQLVGGGSFRWRRCA